MASPTFTALVLVDGNTAHAADVNSQTAGIASYLGNDTVTTDALVASGGVTYLSTDNGDISMNCPNVGGGHKFHLLIGGVHVMTVDSSGNVVFKGTVTASGSPS